MEVGFQTQSADVPKAARGKTLAPVADSVESAKAAGLRYVDDTGPGIVRKGTGRGIQYIGQDENVVRDPQALGRIKALAIPPAWQDVWVCPTPNGHIQATGRDRKGRKQYLYHARWREVRDTEVDR